MMMKYNLVSCGMRVKRPFRPSKESFRSPFCSGTARKLMEVEEGD